MFDNAEDRFKIIHSNVVMDIERIQIPGHTAFRVNFSSNRESLVVTVARHPNSSKFWTSIPEGRQSEAEGMGKLIEQYFESKRN